MATNLCPHGMTEGGCSYCHRTSTGPASVTALSSRTGSRQHLLDELCDVLGVARHAETPGSSPSRVFAAAAASAKVPSSSMPKIGAAIAAKAGLEWGPNCDNRGRNKEATMVTGQGIATVRQALVILADRRESRATKEKS